MNLATLYLSSVLKRFTEYKALGDNTLAQLTEADLYFQPAEASNSIAVVIQHLHGNMLSRWTNFLTEDGEKAWRKRDAEFEVQVNTMPELLQLWSDGWAVFLASLESLQEEDLVKTITIREQPLTVVDAINRQLAHYSYHVGQIVYLGRLCKDNNWQSLSIPKGGSAAYNATLKK